MSCFDSMVSKNYLNVFFLTCCCLFSRVFRVDSYWFKSKQPQVSTVVFQITMHYVRYHQLYEFYTVVYFVIQHWSQPLLLYSRKGVTILCMKCPIFLHFFSSLNAPSRCLKDFFFLIFGIFHVNTIITIFMLHKTA